MILLNYISQLKISHITKVNKNINQYLITSSDLYKYLRIILSIRFLIMYCKNYQASSQSICDSWKTRKFVPEKSLPNLYRVLIQPHLL